MPSPSRSRDAASDPSPEPPSPPEAPVEPPAAKSGPSPSNPFFRPGSGPKSPAPEPDPSPQLPPSWDLHDTPKNSDPGAGGSGSRPRSTRRLRHELRAATRGAVSTVGGMAHRFLTREGSPERVVGLYEPDSEDVKAIGDPLASLASRRMPEGAVTPDSADLMQLALGLAQYVAKQLEKRMRAAAMWAEQEPPADEPTEPTEPQPAPEPPKVAPGGLQLDGITGT